MIIRLLCFHFSRQLVFFLFFSPSPQCKVRDSDSNTVLMFDAVMFLSYLLDLHIICLPSRSLYNGVLFSLPVCISREVISYLKGKLHFTRTCSTVQKSWPRHPTPHFFWDDSPGDLLQACSDKHVDAEYNTTRVCTILTSFKVNICLVLLQYSMNSFGWEVISLRSFQEMFLKDSPKL